MSLSSLFQGTIFPWRAPEYFQSKRLCFRLHRSQSAFRSAGALKSEGGVLSDWKRQQFFFWTQKRLTPRLFFLEILEPHLFQHFFFGCFLFLMVFEKNGPFLVGSDPVDRRKDLRDFTQGKTSITLRFLLADSVLEGMTVNVKMPQRYFN